MPFFIVCIGSPIKTLWESTISESVGTVALIPFACTVALVELATSAKFQTFSAFAAQVLSGTAAV